MCPFILASHHVVVALLPSFAESPPSSSKRRARASFASLPSYVLRHPSYAARPLSSWQLLRLFDAMLLRELCSYRPASTWLRSP